MELSQLTFDAVRGRVDTEEGWWCRFSRQLDTRGSSCPLKGHLLHRLFTGRLIDVSWTGTDQPLWYSQGVTHNLELRNDQKNPSDLFVAFVFEYICHELLWQRDQYFR